MSDRVWTLPEDERQKYVVETSELRPMSDEDRARFVEDINAQILAHEVRVPEVKTYDPMDAKITFNGVELTGFMDGTFLEFLEVERDEGAFKLNAGGTITITLDQTGRPLVWCDAKRDRRRARMRRKKRRGWA